MDVDYDVVIVGGGLVGASLACALRDQAVRVALVESVPIGSIDQPSYDDRSVALAWGARPIFEAMGLWERIGPRAAPIREIHVSDRGHFGAARMKAADYGFDALGYVIENRELGHVFAGVLPAIDNLTVFCPARLSAIRTGADAATVHIERDGEALELRARLVVGADGGRSAVRKAAAIDARRVDYGQSAIVANVSPDRPHGNRAFERFTVDGPLALLPMTDERCALVWTVPTEHCEGVLALDDGAFLSALQSRFGNRLGRFVRAGTRSAYPLALVTAERHVAPRLALIGNAAHTLHPVAGQGFNLGLRDVATLAEVVAHACNDGRDPGDEAILRRYEDWRAADRRRVVTLTDGLVRVFSSDFAPLVVARNTGMVALDLLPVLKGALMRQTMGRAGRLPRLARGIPL